MMQEMEGTIGVVVATRRLAEVNDWLLSWPEVAGSAGGPDARVVALGGLDTKGLEFDGIVVVEPAEIESEAPTGRATLYVVLTRATQQMVTLEQTVPTPIRLPHAHDDHR